MNLQTIDTLYSNIKDSNDLKQSEPITDVVSTSTTKEAHNTLTEVAKSDQNDTIHEIPIESLSMDMDRKKETQKERLFTIPESERPSLDPYERRTSIEFNLEHIEQTHKKFDHKVIELDTYDEVLDHVATQVAKTEEESPADVVFPKHFHWYSSLGSRILSLCNPKYQYDDKVIRRKKFWQVILRLFFLILGPILAIPFMFDILSPGNINVSRACAVLVITAVWWILEPIPIAISSLAPAIFFPMFGVATAGDITSAYFNDTIFLLIGSYIVAIGIEEWGLHKRFALSVLFITRGIPVLILGGFLLISYTLSMWLNNTSTAAMLAPMAAGILANIKEETSGAKGFAVAIMLAIPFGSNLGGSATIIGTTTNLVFSQQLREIFPKYGAFSFLDWFLFAMPMTFIILIILWFYLWIAHVRLYKLSTPPSYFKEELKKLGRFKFEELIIVLAFLLLALLWIFRELPVDNKAGWGLLFKNGYVTDGTAALLMAMLLFMIPSYQRSGDAILSWKKVNTELPWNVFLMIGAGFALARGFEKAGFSQFIGYTLKILSPLHPYLILFIVMLIVIALTNIMSNTALSAIAIPILARMGPNIGQNPILFMLPVAITCSFAFITPIGTPPNAIAYSFGKFKLWNMILDGLVVSFISFTALFVWMIVLGGPIFKIELGVVPIWAQGANTTMNGTIINWL